MPYAATGSGASAEFAAAMQRIEADIVSEAGPRGQEGTARDQRDEKGPLWCAVLGTSANPIAPRIACR